MRRWSKEDIEQLRKLYPRTHIKDLAIRLNRSPNGILAKAFLLGIRAELPYHRPKNWANDPIERYQGLEKTDRAYIAGIIDCEGNINLQWKSNHIDHITLRVSNTSLELINYLEGKLGGSFSLKKVKVKPTHKDLWCWQIQGSMPVRRLLTILLPYLIVKKEKALEVLALRKTQWDM